MHPLPEGIITILTAFAPLFSDRVWQHAQVLLIGAILTPGKRTVSSVLCVMGLSKANHFVNYHRVLNRAVWCTRQGSHILLGLLLRAFCPTGWVVLGVDETIERRSGKKIAQIGCYRDGARSTKNVVIRCFGLKWVCMMLLVKVPWSDRVWALPFLTVLCEPNREDTRRHKSHVDWARGMMCQVRRWLPHRRIVLVADGGFAAVSLAAACQKYKTTFVSRLRWDAVLHHPPEPQPVGKPGRKPKKGQRQRRLKTWAKRCDTPWTKHTVEWYGGKKKEMLLFSRTALWYRTGKDPVPIRYVIVRDKEGKRNDEVFFCTNLNIKPAQIVAWFVMRWSVEVTFQEARAHLGIETQRQWSNLAIARTTPCLLALFSLVTLIIKRLYPKGKLPIQTTAWYHKTKPTFADCLLIVRRHLWQDKFFTNSNQKHDFVQLPNEIFNLLCLYDLPHAA